jgi:DNA-binding MarR family transcriptional regulator
VSDHPDTDDVASVERALGELIRLSTSARVHDARMQAVGLDLTRTEVRFLARLDDIGRRSVSALATELDLSQPTASRALRRLEETGRVRRRADDADGRVANYEITAKGRRERRRLQAYMHDQLASALVQLAPRRRHELARSMEELALHLRAPRKER